MVTIRRRITPPHITLIQAPNRHTHSHTGKEQQQQHGDTALYKLRTGLRHHRGPAVRAERQSFGEASPPSIHRIHRHPSRPTFTDDTTPPKPHRTNREHYRTELHRYNLKRRTNDLGPVTEAEFQRRKAAAQALAGQGANGGGGGGAGAFHAKCAPCSRSFASKATLEQHLQSKKHLQAVAAKEAAACAGGPSGSSGSNSHKAAAAEEEEGTAGPEAEGMEGPVAVPPSMDLRAEVCIFCDAMCGDLEACVLHMWKRHGFHIPDGEYLVDVRGLLRYVAEKVKVGCLCLYCNGKGRKGGFATARDAQRHMADKGHAKLLYEEGEDLHEFRPFYDFSTSYPVGLQKRKGGGGEREEEDEESLETVDSEYEEASDEEGEMEVDDDAEALLRGDVAYVSDLGELVLPGGRTLGNREYSRYYRQRYRPEETRLAVLASREEAAGRGFGVAGGGLSMTTVPGGGGVGSRQVLLSGGGSGDVAERAARRAVLKVTRAARRAQEKIRLRTEISTNKFHKRPDIGV
jgi:pre-60S factor REI1